MCAIKDWNIINDKLKDGQAVSKKDPFLNFNRGFLQLHARAGSFINYLKVYEPGHVVFNRSPLVNDDGIISSTIINGLNADFDYNDNEIIIKY